jgi:hypothetical protein
MTIPKLDMAVAVCLALVVAVVVDADRFSIRIGEVKEAWLGDGRMPPTPSPPVLCENLHVSPLLQ